MRFLLSRFRQRTVSFYLTLDSGLGRKTVSFRPNLDKNSFLSISGRKTVSVCFQPKSFEFNAIVENKIFVLNLQIKTFLAQNSKNAPYERFVFLAPVRP